jgi:hypothetical protein
MIGSPIAFHAQNVLSWSRWIDDTKINTKARYADLSVATIMPSEHPFGHAARSGKCQNALVVARAIDVDSFLVLLIAVVPPQR